MFNKLHFQIACCPSLLFCFTFRRCAVSALTICIRVSAGVSQDVNSPFCEPFVLAPFFPNNLRVEKVCVCVCVCVCVRLCVCVLHVAGFITQFALNWSGNKNKEVQDAQVQRRGCVGKRRSPLWPRQVGNSAKRQPICTQSEVACTLTFPSHPDKEH